MQTQIKKASESMERRVSHMQQEFSEIRAGRANPGVLDKVKVDYYGAPTPVNQLAAVSVTEARTLTVQPWDMSVLRQIEKAILTSDIGINPQNDGKVIRLVFPPLTEDRRKELAKEVKKKGEEAKVAIRNIRRDANDKAKKLNKDNEISDDELSNIEADIQKVTDKITAEIEKMIDNKTDEIMTV